MNVLKQAEEIMRKQAEVALKTADALQEAQAGIHVVPSAPVKTKRLSDKGRQAIVEARLRRAAKERSAKEIQLAAPKRKRGRPPLNKAA